MRFNDSTRALLGAAAIAAVLLALVATACSDQRIAAPGDVGANRPAAAATDENADNTARNVRDRDDKTLTPLDQSDAPADVQITQRIRKEITANDTLSTKAQNVKVITRNGAVTLRGPVDDQRESDLIESYAKASGASSIDNQLEVARGELSRVQ